MVVRLVAGAARRVDVLGGMTGARRAQVLGLLGGGVADVGGLANGFVLVAHDDRSTRDAPCMSRRSRRGPPVHLRIGPRAACACGRTSRAPSRASASRPTAGGWPPSRGSAGS